MLCSNFLHVPWNNCQYWPMSSVKYSKPFTYGGLMCFDVRAMRELSLYELYID